MKLESLARLGYAGRGAVFLMLGYFCVIAAIASTRPPDSSDAFRVLLTKPLGNLLLILIALGLVCFAGWRLAQAFLNSEDCQKNLGGYFKRIVYGSVGIFYVGFASLALSVLVGLHAGNSDTAARDWTTRLLGFPFGRGVIGMIGLILIGIGVGTCVAGIRAEFANRISLPAKARRLVVALGVLGYLTRAVVFTMIGSFLLFAAYYSNANEAVGVAGTLRTIQNQTYGMILLSITAAGFLAFGAFGLAEALFRRIPATPGQAWRLQGYGMS